MRTSRLVGTAMAKDLLFVALCAQVINVYYFNTRRRSGLGSTVNYFMFPSPQRTCAVCFLHDEYCLVAVGYTKAQPTSGPVPTGEYVAPINAPRATTLNVLSYTRRTMSTNVYPHARCALFPALQLMSVRSFLATSNLRWTSSRNSIACRVLVAHRAQQRRYNLPVEGGWTTSGKRHCTQFSRVH